MGLSFTKLFSSLFGKREMRALILGLDCVGKTTILNRLKLGEVIPTIPTIGISLETFELQKVKFTVWDMGMHQKIRQIIKHYYPNTQAIIYVVDSSDKERIELASEELHHLLAQDELRNAALLVLANKQDLCVMSVSQVTQKLGLHSLRERQWHIQGTCVLTGQGLYEGFSWLSKANVRKI